MPDYERLQRLGEGNFGEVWLVFDKALGVHRAVKYVLPERIHDPTRFYHEPRTLMELRHDNIVRVEDAGTENGKLYIAMEYIPRGSIEKRFRGGPVPLSIARRIICDVCWALEYAHQHGYVHRDVKPSNILMAPNGVAKLSDFGLAARAPKGATASPYGYLSHLAPEVLRDEVTSVLTDLYALGVTGYRLVNGDGFLPQPSSSDELQDMILVGCYPDRARYRPYVPTAVKRVLNRAMHIRPDERYQSAAEFRHAFEAVSLKCDWSVRRRQSLVSYLTKINGSVIQMQVEPDASGRFVITTTKKIGNGPKRRISKDCRFGLARTAMKQVLRKILTRYVTHGK